MSRVFAKIENGYYLLTGGQRSHFTTAELSCKDGCGRFLMFQDVIDMIECIREQFGQPVFPNCGVRCLKHNKAVGGAKASQHLPHTPEGAILLDTEIGGAGGAIDFNLKGYSPAKAYRVIDRNAAELGVKGLGRYPGFLHADCRPGKPARWWTEGL